MYIGKKNGANVVIGDVPQEVLASPEFRAQFDAIQLSAAGARKHCAAHIERYYPAHKQLNTLRKGDATEVAKMGAFIDACRAWSNGEAPDPAALEAIQP
ncbi:MAG: hypothetical protein ACT4NV_09885 [Rhodoferax sp.]